MTSVPTNAGSANARRRTSSAPGRSTGGEAMTASSSTRSSLPLTYFVLGEARLWTSAGFTPGRAAMRLVASSSFARNAGVKTSWSLGNSPTTTTLYVSNSRFTSCAARMYGCSCGRSRSGSTSRYKRVDAPARHAVISKTAAITLGDGVRPTWRRWPSGSDSGWASLERLPLYHDPGIPADTKSAAYRSGPMA